MQPLDYFNTTAGLIWVILCMPLGFVLTALGFMIINHIPAAWLCDYNETPSAELLSGKRVSFLPFGIPVSVFASAALVLCRLGFNKGFDIYFCALAVISMLCVMIAAADLKYQIIPDQFTVALGVMTLGLSLYDILRGYKIFHFAWWSPIVGALIGAAAMIVIDLIGMLIYKKEGMGFGDVKLFFAVGILGGFPGTIYVFLIAILSATVFFVIILAVKGRSASAEDETDEQIAANENTEKQDNAEDGKEQDEESGQTDTEVAEKPGGGPYLAFGPYIAAALILYAAFYDTINSLVQMYLDLF